MNYDYRILEYDEPGKLAAAVVAYMNDPAALGAGMRWVPTGNLAVVATVETVERKATTRNVFSYIQPMMLVQNYGGNV